MSQVTVGESARSCAHGPWLSQVAPGLGVGGPGVQAPPLGIVLGEGIGAEVISAALHVLDAIEAVVPTGLTRLTSGPIVPSHEGLLSDDIAEFCQHVFQGGGAVLCGPGRGRFVYDLRRRFNLFCKLAPIRPIPPLYHLSMVKVDRISEVDILVVRDNAGGIYQGRWSLTGDAEHGTIAEHHFSYTQSQVEELVGVAARLARLRQGRMEVVIKDGGVPAISDLWRQVACEVADRTGVDCGFCNVDFAAYDLIHRAHRFDVIVAPNMIGDILADLGAVFLGSRGLLYSANFSPSGYAIYQTGHGAAHDLSGTDRANPVAQILALAMMLRESYGLETAAIRIESAIEAVYRAGYRTDDLLEPGCRRVGTQEFGNRIAQEILREPRTAECA